MEFSELRGIPEKKVLEDIYTLYLELIDRPGKDYFYDRISGHPDIYSILAYENGILAGFKIGYPEGGNTFYSWLGGVKEPFRRKGLARELMRIQHVRLKDEGFELIRTKTKNIYRNMLVLNILSGFNIIETYKDKFGEPKIVLEKKL